MSQPMSRRHIAIIGALTGCIALAAGLFVSQQPVAAPLALEQAMPSVTVHVFPTLTARLPPATATLQPSPTSVIVVYISGAVQHPDVYRLAPDARVDDLVSAAGGLNADAAAEQINLAAHVSDGEHVHVPRLGDTPVIVQSTAVPGSSGQHASPAPTPGLLDINTADATALESLPGIGPALAARILAYRAEHGAFQNIDDLDDVSGIGPALLAKIRPYITVSRQ